MSRSRLVAKSVFLSAVLSSAALGLITGCAPKSTSSNVKVDAPKIPDFPTLTPTGVPGFPTAFGEQVQQIACWQTKPTCRELGSMAGQTDLTLTAPAIDQLHLVATMSYAVGHNSSVMRMSLTDGLNSEPLVVSYVVNDNDTVIGGFEDFVGQNGTHYTLRCSGAHAPQGMPMEPFPQCFR